MAAAQAAMEMSEALPNIFYDGYIYINSNLSTLTKFTTSSRSTKSKDIFPQNISQVITKTIPISTRIALKF